MLWIRSRSLPLLFGLAALWLAASTAQAEQFVLFDATFKFTKEDADNSKPSPSHYYVRDKLMNAERPKNWTSPVDYRTGTAHVRLEVLEKPPGNEATTWSVCYIPNKGQKNGYGCFRQTVGRVLILSRRGRATASSHV